MTEQDEQQWQALLDALRLIQSDFATLHALVMEEIGHPLPPDLRDFVRDWLDTAAHAAEKKR